MRFPARWPAGRWPSIPHRSILRQLPKRWKKENRCRIKFARPASASAARARVGIKKIRGIEEQFVHFMEQPVGQTLREVRPRRERPEARHQVRHGSPAVRKNKSNVGKARRGAVKNYTGDGASGFRS